MRKKIKTAAKTMGIAAFAWTYLAIHFYRTGRKNKKNT